MKFIINKRIIFHEDKSTIELRDDVIEPVMLTATLCRVLSLLVKNNNLLLSRDFLLSNAWDEYGKSSSNSNLNNYISMLRKIFNSLGENDIIVTMPRQGFMFKAEEVNTVDSEETLNSANSIAPASLIEKNWKLAGLFAFPLMAIAFGMSVAYPFLDKYEPVSHNKIGKVNNCTIEILTASHYVKHGEDDLKKIKPLIESAKFDCNIPATIYYFNSTMLVSRVGINNSISFLSYCPTSKLDGVDAQCENSHEITDKKQL